MGWAGGRGDGKEKESGCFGFVRGWCSLRS